MSIKSLSDLPSGKLTVGVLEEKIRARQMHGLLRDFDARKVLAHLNSVKNTPTFSYEGADHGCMYVYWREILSSLPPESIEKIGSGDFMEILRGFTPYESALEAKSLEKRCSKSKAEERKAGREYTPFFRSSDSSTGYFYSKEELSALQTRVKGGDLVVFPAGYKEHAVAIVFWKGYMLICNRGDHLEEHTQNIGDRLKTIRAYKIGQHRKTTFLTRIQDALHKDREEGLKLLYETLPTALNVSQDTICQQLESLSSGDQKVGNCTSASLKEALMGVFALASLKENTEGHYLESEDLIRAKELKKMVSAHARLMYLDIYYKKHLSVRSGECDMGAFDPHLASICQKKAGSHMKHIEKLGISIKESYPEVYAHFSPAVKIAACFRRTFQS